MKSFCAISLVYFLCMSFSCSYSDKKSERALLVFNRDFHVIVPIIKEKGLESAFEDLQNSEVKQLFLNKNVTVGSGFYKLLHYYDASKPIDSADGISISFEKNTLFNRMTHDFFVSLTNKFDEKAVISRDSNNVTTLGSNESGGYVATSYILLRGVSFYIQCFTSSKSENDKLWVTSRVMHYADLFIKFNESKVSFDYQNEFNL